MPPKPTFSGYQKVWITVPDVFQMRNRLLSYRNAPEADLFWLPKIMNYGTRRFPDEKQTVKL